MAKRKNSKPAGVDAVESVSALISVSNTLDLSAETPSPTVEHAEVFAAAPAELSPTTIAITEDEKIAPPAELAAADAGEGADARVAATEVASPGEIIAPIALAAPDAASRWGDKRRRRSNRMFAQAASIALAAALGAVVGSMATAFFNHSSGSASTDKTIGALAVMTDQIAKDLRSFKGTATASAQDTDARLATLSDGLDRAERAQADIAAKVAKVATQFDGGEKAAVSPEITGTVNVAKPAVAEGWTLWRVYNGRALVQGNRRYFDVRQGSDLPGLGKVKDIAWQDGRWVVVTETGIIVPRGPLT